MAIDESNVLQQAAEFLEAGDGAMDAIRIHEFELDGDEHDDDAVELLHQDFKKDFDAATRVLTVKYGAPSHSGSDDDDAIPLTGIQAFNIWSMGDQGLFLAISHEDRGTPILLMLGCTE
ncbi:MAG: hypothetical protein KJZ78_30075 [Bryobacteraceae bacterium]|nr:hypothetical protein [Bryobacteraceae bacterium]